jgi:hypothetical protein
MLLPEIEVVTTVFEFEKYIVAPVKVNEVDYVN